MDKVVRRTALAALVVVVTALPARAQQPFADVQHVLRPGDTVYLTDMTNNQIRGRLAWMDASMLRLTVNGTEREWPATAVWRLERRGDSVKDGARRGVLTGAVVGGVLGAIAGATWANSGSGSTPLGGALGLGMVGAGLGLGIGITIDAVVQGRTPVYQRQ